MKNSVGFTKLPHTFLSDISDLSGTEKIIYITIYQAGLCYMSIATIASIAGVSKRTTQRAIDSIRCRGLIRQINTSSQVSIRIAKHSELFRLSAEEIVKMTPIRVKRGELTWREITSPTVANLAMVSICHHSYSDYGTVAKFNSHRSHGGYRTRVNNYIKELDGKNLENCTNAEFGSGYLEFKNIVSLILKKIVKINKGESS